MVHCSAISLYSSSCRFSTSKVALAARNSLSALVHLGDLRWPWPGRPCCWPGPPSTCTRSPCGPSRSPSLDVELQEVAIEIFLYCSYSCSTARSCCWRPESLLDQFPELFELLGGPLDLHLGQGDVPLEVLHHLRRVVPLDVLLQVDLGQFVLDLRLLDLALGLVLLDREFLLGGLDLGLGLLDLDLLLGDVLGRSRSGRTGRRPPPASPRSPRARAGMILISRPWDLADAVDGLGALQVPPLG